MRTWQPIETAPLDGGFPHYFLVYTSHKNTLMACGMEGELTYLTFMDGISFDTNCYGKPTHWMPLPKPPASINGNMTTHKQTGETK